MAKAAKRIPPSRVRYENSHPTVTCRVSGEFYDSLMAARRVEGRSFADILKAGLGKVEERNEQLAEARRGGYEEGRKKGRADALDEANKRVAEAKKESYGNGYTDGHNDAVKEANKVVAEATTLWTQDGYKMGRAEAERLYKVVYHCSKCGRPMVVKSEKEKKAVDEHMSRLWHHNQCLAR